MRILFSSLIEDVYMDENLKKGKFDFLFPPITDYEDYSLRYSKTQRIAMFIEGIAVYALVMILLWVFWWQESPLHNMTISSAGLVIILVYILFISPRIYKDTTEDWGMGTVVDYFQLMFGKPRCRKPNEETPKGYRIVAIIWFTVVNLALIIAAILFWDTLAPFAVDWLDSLIQNLRMREGLGIEITEEHMVPAVIAAILLIELIIFGLFRYDNFRSSFKWMVRMMVPMLPILIIVLCVYYFGAGPDTWQYKGKSFELGDFIVGWLGYIVWGSIQQLLFLGYFNTRIRKAILGYEWKYSKYAPLISTAICSSFFAIIHLPSLLALFTAIGGAYWAWYFQKKGQQNILVSGIFHGLFGTILGSYLAFIPFSVGPEKITF
jgi:membrane protein YdbS with pleckstrin-like domain